MFYKRLAFLIVLTICSLVSAQTRNNEWQVGVGFGITRFADDYAQSINDKHQLQVPRFNITFPIIENVSIDTAVSVNTFGLEIIENSAFYFSTDISARYHYEVTQWFFPYVFLGASAVNSDYKIAPSLNLGGGVTFWINNLVGLNAQTYYKNTLDSSEYSRSHLQFTGGLVFAIDMFDLLYFGRVGKVCF